jgi:hypothetical protein
LRGWKENLPEEAEGYLNFTLTIFLNIKKPGYKSGSLFSRKTPSGLDSYYKPMRWYPNSAILIPQLVL